MSYCVICVVFYFYGYVPPVVCSVGDNKIRNEHSYTTNNWKERPVQVQHNTNRKKHALVRALCEVKNHFIVIYIVALLQSVKVLKCKLRKKRKY
jgi:hypothetical protein